MKPFKSLKEYSKRVIALLIVLWFIGGLFGIGVVITQLILTPDIVSLDIVLAYIGAPMTGGIITYLIKSAMENRMKIQQSFGDSDEYSDDLEDESEDNEI